MRAFEFARSEAGPRLATGDALKVAEQVVVAGPGAAENFVQGYRYGISKSGLDLDSSSALTFARQMSGKTAVDSEGFQRALASKPTSTAHSPDTETSK